ncbi:MAG: four helix bundle protein [Patescibacteria group bacterium]
MHNIIRDFEKLERYTLGVTIEKTVLDCITACHAATTLREPKEKYEKINAASSLFDTVKLLVRIGIEIHQIEERQFVNLIPRFGKIGRMLGGWMRVTAKPTQNQNQS